MMMLFTTAQSLLTAELVEIQPLLEKKIEMLSICSFSLNQIFDTSLNYF